MPAPAEKPKEDRLRETLTILQKLREIGIPDSDPGYLNVKALMSQWVKDGLASATKVEFPRFGRRGELVLPRRADRAASLNLKGSNVEC
jgi:hypothetical protein